MPTFSIIVLNWNGKHFLGACLSSLRKQTFRDFEVLLVDNASQDGSVDYVQAEFPEVTVVALDENRGFAGGNIAGFEQSYGEIVVLLNNDTEVHPGWLEALDHASRSYPQAGSFACKMLYFDERNRLDNCGYFLSPGGFSVEIGRDQLDGPEYSGYRWVFGACGGAVAYRRTMLDEVGFLDPDFFVTYEDVDLSFRAQLRGFPCLFVPYAIVYHRYRATMAKFPKRQVFFSQRNIEFVYIKNMPLGLMLHGLIQRLLYFTAAMVFFTRQGAGPAFLRAKWAAVQAFPSLIRKRRQIQRSTTVANRQLRSLMAKGAVAARARKFFAGFRRITQAA